MNYALLFYVEDRAFEGFSPEQQRLFDHDCAAFDEELKQSGHMIATSALRPPSEAVTIKARGDRISTTDGPFAETKEHLGGFILVKARDLNEAISIAARMPVAQKGRIEVRPAFSPEL